MLVSPSVLAADFSKLAEEVAAVSKAGADWIHFDVMDNHFVPNLTVGPMVCQSLRTHFSDIFLDVHLMVDPVDAMIEQFAKAGANLISFHPEATKHLHRSIQLIKSFDIKVGLAINPATPLAIVKEVATQIDLILIMSVNPGFGGQKFIATSLQKIAQAKQLHKTVLTDSSVEYIQVDGGINANNIKSVTNAGANCVVAGTYIFGSDNYSDAISQLKMQN